MRCICHGARPPRTRAIASSSKVERRIPAVSRITQAFERYFVAASRFVSSVFKPARSNSTTIWAVFAASELCAYEAVDTVSDAYIENPFSFNTDGQFRQAGQWRNPREDSRCRVLSRVKFA